jgi:hypothetical protein
MRLEIVRSFAWLLNTPQALRELLQRYPGHGQIHKLRQHY